MPIIAAVVLAKERADLGGYPLILAGGDDERAALRVRGGNLPVVPFSAGAAGIGAEGVARLVDGNAEEGEAAGGAGADLRGVLAAAPGGDQHVDPVHGRRHRRDRRAEPVQVDVEAEHGPLVARGGAVEHLAHVAGARQAGQARAAPGGFPGRPRARAAACARVLRATKPGPGPPSPTAWPPPARRAG